MNMSLLYELVALNRLPTTSTELNLRHKYSSIMYPQQNYIIMLEKSI